jgi:hypothetical protein
MLLMVLSHAVLTGGESEVSAGAAQVAGNLSAGYFEQRLTCRVGIFSMAQHLHKTLLLRRLLEMPLANTE